MVKMNRVSGLLLVLLVAVSLSGLTYAHWSDTVRIEGTAKMAHIRTTIISYKALTPKKVQEYATVNASLSEDGHLLTLSCSNLKPCWYIWVGLVLQNQGTLPANVKPPAYEFEGPDGFHDYFEVADYCYGPYPESQGFGNLELWGKVTVGEGGSLLPDGTNTFTTLPQPGPFPTDPGEKAVIWIWIHCKATVPPDAQGLTGLLYIQIVDDMAI
jgi:hypothetical protein